MWLISITIAYDRYWSDGRREGFGLCGWIIYNASIDLVGFNLIAKPDKIQYVLFALLFFLQWLW